MTLLDVSALRVEYPGQSGAVVDDLSFTLGAGESLGLVGESGSGKTVTALSVMQLVPSPPGRIRGGRIRFDGIELTERPERALRRLRGKSLAMVFQESMTSLNPAFTIGDQIRRRLYLDLVELAFDPRREEISEFMLDGFTEVKSRVPPSRDTLVGELLHAVLDLQLLCGRPVVFVFDALETLLHDPPELERSSAFTRGLADVIARAVGDQMSKTLGQPIIVENRAGAGGGIEAEVALPTRAQPGGKRRGSASGADQR